MLLFHVQTMKATRKGHFFKLSWQAVSKREYRWHEQSIKSYVWGLISMPVCICNILCGLNLEKSPFVNGKSSAKGCVQTCNKAHPSSSKLTPGQCWTSNLPPGTSKPVWARIYSWSWRVNLLRTASVRLALGLLKQFHENLHREDCELLQWLSWLFDFNNLASWCYLDLIFSKLFNKRRKLKP